MMFALIIDKLKGAWLGWSYGYNAVAMSAVTGFKQKHIHLLERRRNRRERREAPSAVVAVFDLDNFKSINDKMGHAVGDLVLNLFGEVCKWHFPRDADKLVRKFRFGGDEFVLEMVGQKQEWLEVRVAAISVSFALVLRTKEFIAQALDLSIDPEVDPDLIFSKVFARSAIAEKPDSGQAFREADRILHGSKSSKSYCYR